MENAHKNGAVAEHPVPYAISTGYPALENGDRLSRFEFERRYHRMPRVKKAELVEGIVYMPSPVRVIQHGRPHMHANTWLGYYDAVTPGVMSCDNVTVRLDPENEPQPDALLRIDEKRGGQSRISQDDYIEGPPELIVEIASSSASYDMHDKFRVYRRNGVLEYLVWLVQERDFRWYLLTDGEYQLQSPDDGGILESRTFPGLRLDVTALLKGDMRSVLFALQRGIESDGHRGFAARLAGG